MLTCLTIPASQRRPYWKGIRRVSRSKELTLWPIWRSRISIWQARLRTWRSWSWERRLRTFHRNWEPTTLKTSRTSSTSRLSLQATTEMKSSKEIGWLRSSSWRTSSQQSLTCKRSTRPRSSLVTPLTKLSETSRWLSRQLNNSRNRLSSQKMHQISNHWHPRLEQL